MSGLKSRRSGAHRRSAATVANTVAKPLDGARRTWTTLEYRPSLRPVRTVLDDVPTPTDQKVAGSSAWDMREMSEAPVIKAVTSAEVSRSAQEPARAAYPVVRKQRHADRIPPS
jgi:hypothetical protein